ncbi:NUDIX hydrolase [Natronoglycomyces albus]|uniref:NUDIX domain-containing protein n=1 Tax=Natronoglycomyces albus TaxID=2811108 RepID=A0A895XWU8_9ACTN|nr:NUDIX domain-containing protein [Natronoglycomyces albus]QSB06108.1 NUDIX domain-containing protein [Natronoglycomyces albus]
MRSKQRHVAAAGGLLWREGKGGELEVAIVWRPSVGNWSLPKGKLDGDEHPLTAACREVEEETGVPVIPQVWLTQASYILQNPDQPDVFKTVDFWSMRTEQPHAQFVADEEIGQRAWVSLARARHILTRPRDQQALAAFGAIPAVTATVIVAAPAAVETNFPGPEVTRPLSLEGEKSAQALAALANLYRPRMALTATARACVQTTEAAATDRYSVNGDSIFDAEAHSRNPERSGQRIRELAVVGGSSFVCAEPATIADSLAILADEDGLEVPNVSTPPGGAWVLSFAGQRLIRAERLR